LLAEADVIKYHVYDKQAFIRKLHEKQEKSPDVSPDFILETLADSFTYDELMQCLHNTKGSRTEAEQKLILHTLSMASIHYEIDFSIDSSISERVIFPISATEQKGIENARFVKFTDDTEQPTYFATFTANDQTNAIPKLIRTTDFYKFEILPINNGMDCNKGMALFPRKINGKYAMLCQADGVNNYIAYSDNLISWQKAIRIQQPKYTWELLQTSNAGSPVETEDGWLVLTHGVGPMNKCVISASLFDIDNPEKEIGRLSTPLLVPNESEREGAVPNVVFSCGSILHGKDLIIPYSISNHTSTYATVDLSELLHALKGEENKMHNVRNPNERMMGIEMNSEMKVA
jgi:beta-1,2-mannobiose phosphorylase / 1,2-beta-oligomannan phosphorylase